MPIFESKNSNSKSDINQVFYLSFLLQNIPDSMLALHLSDLEINVRVHNALVAQNIVSIEDLRTAICVQKVNPLRWKNFGVGSLTNLVAAIQSVNSDPSKLKRGSLGQKGSNTHPPLIFATNLHHNHKPSKTTDLKTVLDAMPKSVLDSPISDFPLTTRLANAFRDRDVRFVRDLGKLDTKTLFTWANVGKKSITKLIDALVNYQDTTDVKNPYSERETPILKQFDSACHLTERQVFVLKSRWGYEAPPKTLEEVGYVLEVTRERVRQIEKAAKSKFFTKKRKSTLRKKILDLLANRSDPLYLDLIEIEDDWFAQSADHQTVIENIIDEVLEGEFSILTLNSRKIVSKCSNKQFDDLQRVFLEYLSENISIEFSLEDLELMAEARLAEVGCTELTPLFIASIKPHLIFSEPQNEENDGAVLLAIGNTKISVISAVLANAETPLHYTEVKKACSDFSGKNFSERYVHAILGYCGAHLFGRGVYGLEKHILLDLSEQDEICSAVEDILHESHYRQWHADEILDCLDAQGVLTDEDLDKYVLTAVLKKSKRIDYLGRMIFAPSGADLEVRNRVEVEEAFEVILRKAGKPLSTREILESLSKTRGVATNIMCHPNSNITRIARGKWGLVERDFILSRRGIDELLSSLAAVLAEHKKGVHHSNLANFATLHGLPIPDLMDGYQIMGLTLTDGRFRVFRGGVVGLSTWTQSHQISVLDAVKKIVAENKMPILRSDFIEQLEKIADREINFASLSGVLGEASVRYSSKLDAIVLDSRK